MAVEQRKYYRRQFSENPPSAVLLLERRKVECWLVEMSLGGFAVLVAKELTTAMHSLARLKVQGLEYIVRLTRQESLGDCYLIGMVQIEEVRPSPVEIPATPLSQWLATATWVAALGSLGVAWYFLSGWYSNLLPWSDWS